MSEQPKLKPCPFCGAPAVSALQEIEALIGNYGKCEHDPAVDGMDTLSLLWRLARLAKKGLGEE